MRPDPNPQHGVTHTLYTARGRERESWLVGAEQLGERERERFSQSNIARGVGLRTRDTHTNHQYEMAVQEVVSIFI